ncbi:MAG: RecQ family ATP-dependent DNA helicase, partial [Planctomycetes bacterium]|nr:RecQ family ATP-dependent DNA helicase [Planctomycetota bacterium]
MIPFDDIQRIESVLQEVFGHRKLRPAQERALAPILAGKDAVVIMPTGTGKSLCYQLPGLLDEGLTLVVSPLISLMKDQVDSLRALGVPAGTMNSSQSADEARSVFSDLHGGVLRFLYVSPERLSQPAFAELMARSNLRRVAVDEAHCVSAWGHDFRPDYLQVGGFLDRVGRPQTLALTATATPAVQEDIVRSLGLDDPQVVVTGFDRPNLSIYVRRVRGAAEHGESLNRAFDEFDAVTGAALVYCASRKNTELVA